MPRKVIAVAPRFRDGMIAVVKESLAKAGIKYDPRTRPVEVHREGTVSIRLTESELQTVKEFPFFTQYNRVKGTGEYLLVRCSWLEIDNFANENSPVLTDAERAARKSKGTRNTASSEEIARYKQLMEERLQRMMERHNVDLIGEMPDESEDSDEDEI